MTGLLLVLLPTAKKNPLFWRLVMSNMGPATIGWNGNLVAHGHEIIDVRGRKIRLPHINRQIRRKRHRRIAVGPDGDVHTDGVGRYGNAVTIKYVADDDLVKKGPEVIIRRIVIRLLIPLLRAGGNNKCPRRHHVRLVTPKDAFNPNADV